MASYFNQTLFPGSRIYLPTDPNDSNETIQRWATLDPPRYIVSVQPALKADVQGVLRKFALPSIYAHPANPLVPLITIKEYKSQIQFTPIPQMSFGKPNNTPFLSTGGGHGYSTTLGTLQNSIELDPSLFSSSNINATTNAMTIGGSVIFSEALPALQAAGR